MRAVVVYESMYGNTHRVADAIGRGLGRAADVAVVPVERADQAAVERADLVVVGGPTHAHGMSRQRTRKAAIDQAGEPGSGLVVDRGAGAAGLRDWFTALGPLDVRSAAFDTRIHAPSVVTGRASKGIARELHQHGSRPLAEPESFFVGKDNVLSPGEEERAEEWGVRLGREASKPS